MIWLTLLIFIHFGYILPINGAIKSQQESEKKFFKNYLENDIKDIKKFDEILEIITVQKEIFNFSNFLLLCDSQLYDDIKSYNIDIKYFIGEIQKRLNIPIVLIKDNQGLLIEKIKKKYEIIWNKNTFVLILSNEIENDFMIKIQKFYITYLTLTRILIGIFATKIEIKDENYKKTFLNQFFQWNWEHYRIINVAIVIVLKNFLNNTKNEFLTEVYKYTPFPKYKFINLTIRTTDNNIINNKNFGYKNLYLKHIRDLQGYEIKSPIIDDYPRVFSFYKNGEFHFDGRAVSVFENFLHYINATFKPIIPLTDEKDENLKLNKVDIYEIFNSNQLEIGLLTTGKPNFNSKYKIDFTYPYSIPKWCLMIPHSPEIKEYQYLILPFQTDVWLTLMGFILFLSIIEKIIFKTMHIKRSFSSAVMDSICKLLLLPVNSYVIKLQSNRILILFITLLEFIAGFIISNYYLTFLSSFLATTVYEKQITTWSQLKKSQIKILLIDYQRTKFFNDNFNFTKKFLNQVVTMDRDTVTKLRLNLNTSYAYTIDNMKAKFILAQQWNSSRPLFHFSKLCLTSNFLSFPIRRNSPLKGAFQMYVTIIRASGLIKHWLEKSFSNAKYAGLIKTINRETRHKNLMQLEHFRYAIYILGMGWIIGTICFLIEIKYFQIICGKK